MTYPLLQVSAVPVFSGDAGGGFVFLLVIAFWVLLFLLHVACAQAVAADGKRYTRKHHGTVLLPSVLWTLATLLTGLWGLVAYWAIHRSMLNPKNVTQAQD